MVIELNSETVEQYSMPSVSGCIYRQMADGSLEYDEYASHSWVKISY